MAPSQQCGSIALRRAFPSTVRSMLATIRVASESPACTGSASRTAQGLANAIVIVLSLRVPPAEARLPLRAMLHPCNIRALMPSINYMPGSYGRAFQVSLATQLVAEAARPLTASVGDGRYLLAAPHQFPRARPHEAESRDGASPVGGTRRSAPAI